MAAPTPKELREIAKACRAAGIKTYKVGDVELTFSDEVPTKRVRKPTKAASSTNALPDKVDEEGWESLTETEKLFWSSEGGIPLRFPSE